MALENRGVPTVLICNEPFRNSAQAHARHFGRRDYPLVVLPNQWPGDEEGLRQLARSAFDQVVAILSRR